MSTTSFEALRRANPRARTGFADSVDAASDAIRARIMASTIEGAAPQAQRRSSRRRLVRISAVGVTVATAAVATAFLTIGTSGRAPGVENATAAIKKAATLSARSAEHSGTVDVRITHDGRLWASKVVRWNGDDVEISDHSPGGPSSGSPLLVVDGVLYGHDDGPDHWVEVGPVSSIDPGSGATPTEQLAAIREDVGGTTLQRMVAAMTGLTRADQSDGSTVYSGTVTAGLIARETGFKEGQAIRVFPFGYVAHDEAANANAPLAVAVTVGADRIIREIAVSWGTAASAWRYTVDYSALGATPALVAPANATSLEDLRRPTTTTPSTG